MSWFVYETIVEIKVIAGRNSKEVYAYNTRKLLEILLLFKIVKQLPELKQDLRG